MLVCVEKLKDHIGLEAQRMTASQFGHHEIAAARMSFNKNLEEQKRSLEQLVEKQNSAENELNHVRNQHIAILGVFAAVVLTFNGAIGFSASSIEVMGSAPSFGNVVFIVSIVGFVLINAVGLLLGFVWHLSQGNNRVPTSSWVILVITDTALLVLIALILCIPEVLPQTLALR